MPPKTHTRTLRIRRLASELRQLRESADLSREDVTAATRINGSTLYRIETGQTRPQNRTLHTLCETYSVGEKTRQRLLALAQDSNKQDWLATYPSELPGVYSNFIAFEAEAASVRNYESLFVPGLLQTETYCRSVVRGTAPQATVAQQEDRVRARLQRQELLHTATPLQLCAVIDEAALRHHVGGPAAMSDQVLHLRELSAMQNVEIRVIPFAVGAHPGMPGSFALIEFPEPEDPEVVYIDSMAGDLFLEGEAEVNRYSSIFEQLRTLAASPGESYELLTRTASELIEGTHS